MAKLRLSELKITLVTVRFGVTANLGNYNSVNFAEEITAEVLPGQNPDDIRKTLLDEIEAVVFDKASRMKGKKAQTQEDLL